MSLVLIGFKKSGKTTIGKLLAEKAKVAFYDTDHVALKLYEEESVVLESCYEIACKYGEKYFRNLETKSINYLQFRKKPMVVATGGGALLKEENISLLRNLGKLIYLKWPIEIIEKRIFLFREKTYFVKNGSLVSNFANIFSKRCSIFEKEADLILDCQGKTEKQILESLSNSCNITDSEWVYKNVK